MTAPCATLASGNSGKSRMSAFGARSGKRLRAFSYLRCHRFATWFCALVLIVGMTHCQRWVQVYATSQKQQNIVKLRTLPRHFLNSQGREKHAVQVSTDFASQALPGQEVQFKEDQSILPVLLALVLVFAGLVRRQDAIAIFGVYQFCCAMSTHSILETFHVWEQASLDMLELYSEFAVAMPVLAKSVTSGVAYIAGDLMAQKIEGKRIDIFRCSHNALAGFVLHGPLLHYWILLLEGPFSQFFWNPNGWRCIMMKVVLDQTIFAATLNTAYAVFLGLLAGKRPKETLADVRQTLPMAMWSSWRFWPFVHLVTYSPLLPIQLKVLWNDVVEVAWVAILSFVVNANNSEPKRKEEDLPLAVPV